MNEDHVSNVSVSINAPVSKVWTALINPEMIRKYLFGTNAISDWKEGSFITYKGVWEGKEYEDKGKIVKLIPEKLLETTYWSGMSGQADVSENYKNVIYALSSEEGTTKLTITQDNNATDEEKNESEKNWKMVLHSLKKLLEQ